MGKNIYLGIFSILLLWSIFVYVNYLTSNNYISETFDVNIIIDRGLPDTNHTVNLPLTTAYSCKNFCGPTSRCSVTGQQCMADIDCPGCNPYTPTLSTNPISKEFIRGNNDAGILTNGVTPKYSSLTTDIGTQAKLYVSNKDKLNKPAMANFGVNTWITGFNESMYEFDKRYRPYGLKFTPDYKKRYTMTGEFMDDGPLASNAYL
jgi:hypothetical protein